MRFNKSGAIELTSGFFSKGVIAVLVILGVLFFSGNIFGQVGKYASWIPDIVTQADVDLSRVGINLKDGSLNYFTGAKWRKIETKDNVEFRLNGYKFKSDDLRKRVIDYYGGGRDPNELIIDVNDWRYWIVSRGNMISYGGGNIGNILVISSTKNGYSGKSLKSQSILKYDDLLQDAVSLRLDILKAESFLSSRPLRKVIDWREQFLEGGVCEKSIVLEVKVGEGDNVKYESKTYNVKKRFDYLVVDLDEEFIGGNTEIVKGCFRYENYDDGKIDRSDWKNEYDVEISFDYLESIGSRYWPKDFYVKSGIIWDDFDGNSLKSWRLFESQEGIIFSDKESKDFYLGLKKALETFSDEENGKSFYGFNKKRNTINIKGTIYTYDSNNHKIEVKTILDVEEFNDKSNIEKIIYKILEEYNKHLVPLPYSEPSLPEFFFYIENVNSGTGAKLLDKNGADQQLSVINGNILVGGQKSIGIIEPNTGLIIIDYGAAGVTKGLIPYLNFIDGNIFYEIIYGTSPGSFSYKKLERSEIPVNVLEVGA